MKERKRLGLALCGSYCTYEKVLAEAEKLAEDWGPGILGNSKK